MLLVAAGLLLLAVGVGAVLAVTVGRVAGVGAGVAVLGGGLIGGGLFLVPVAEPSGPAGERPVHGVIP